jgi:hypothetical protein
MIAPAATPESHPRTWFMIAYIPARDVDPSGLPSAAAPALARVRAPVRHIR